MVFYRKYRPQKIEELDSSDVREKLFSVLSSKETAHAFLFTGPKGLGKTSAARIVAKAVNCEEKSKIKSMSRVESRDQKSKLQLKTQKLRNEETKDQIAPCNECYQCVSITNGTNIDEIRDLREKVRLSPATAKKKVYIIDEVHMLTTEAFNALLKTLEEPPSHVIFVLCTTEPHKVPGTITSRCFHIPFRKATTEELMRSFERIGEKEKLMVEKEALNFIARLSDGSFRDGSKILEEIVLLSKGKKITKEIVEAKYQTLNIKNQIEKTIEALSKREAKEGLKLVSELVEDGVDMKYFIEELIAELHQMLLRQIGVEDARSPVRESSKFNPSTSFGTGVQSSKLSIGEIKELVEVLVKAHADLKYAILPQLPLELAIVEWGLVNKGSPHPLNDSSKPSGNTRIGNENSSISTAARLSNYDYKETVKSSFREGARPAGDHRTARSNSFWQDLIDRAKSYNHSIAGVLRGCRMKSYNDKKIVIETDYKFHKERLDDEKTMKILEKVCKEISGKKIEVSVALKEG